MSKFSIIKLWNEFFGTEDEVYDYAGRRMLKSACGNPNSAFHPTVDHVRPLADGGKDVKENVIICHHLTNEETDDSFPHWKSNGSRFHAKRIKGLKNGYTIINEERKS